MVSSLLWVWSTLPCFAVAFNTTLSSSKYTAHSFLLDATAAEGRSYTEHQKMVYSFEQVSTSLHSILMANKVKIDPSFKLDWTPCYDDFLVSFLLFSFRPNFLISYSTVRKACSPSGLHRSHAWVHHHSFHTTPGTKCDCLYRGYSNKPRRARWLRNKISSLRPGATPQHQAWSRQLCQPDFL